VVEILLTNTITMMEIVRISATMIPIVMAIPIRKLEIV
jgi:hypothetical protein